MRYSRLEYGKGIFQLPYALAHFCYFSMQLVGVAKYKSGVCASAQWTMFQVSSITSTSLASWMGPATDERSRSGG